MWHLIIPVLIIVSMAMLALSVKQLFTGRSAGSCINSGKDKKDNIGCNCRNGDCYNSIE